MFFNRKKKESTKKAADKNNDVKNDTTESDEKIDVDAYDYYKLFEKYFKYSPDYEIHYEEALEYALKAAECGLDSGLYEIGDYYLSLRDATDADKERAFNALKAGADLGGILSKFSLAKCYEQGAGTEIDIEKAIYWYGEVAKNDKESLGDEAKQKIEELKSRNDSALAEKLAEKKAKEEAEAKKKQKELDDYYNTEEGKQELYNRYLSGALKGYAVSQYSLGICNREGRGTAVDKGMALRWFTAAAENGHLEAMYETAKCYENGEGTAVSKPMAFYWYLRAAGDGHEVSKNIVNQITPDEAIDYLNSVCKSENEKLSSDAQRLKEHIEIELYKDGAENGNIDAMRNLSICYEEGLGTDADLSKAFYWRTKAAEAGDTDSQYHLGVYYKKGTGTEKDEKKAFYWFRTASENGHIDAMYELASCYEFGIGTTADVDVAFYLFNELGLKGYLPAKYAMGDLIIAEDLTSEQMEIALYWFEQAGEAGYRDSQGMLYTFYTYGINTVSKDEKKSPVLA